MRRFIAILAVFCASGAWALDAREGAAPGPAQRFFTATQLAARFDCSNRKCTELRSCEEACYKLIQCGQRIRDRDNDGIPCENLCSRPCPR